MPRRLTAAQCSAAAVCAARIRSPYGRYLGQVSDCTCRPGSLACALFCCSLLLLPGNPAWPAGWPAGWLAWPGVSLAARCCLSSLSLTFFPFPTAVGHFEKREHTACLASMACLEAAAYWNSRTLLSPSHHCCHHHHQRRCHHVISTVGPRPRAECQPTRAGLIHFSPVSPSDCPACLPAPLPALPCLTA